MPFTSCHVFPGIKKREYSRKRLYAFRTHRYVVRVGSQQWTPNAKRWKKALPQSAAWRYREVMERAIKAGPVLAGTNDPLLCQGREKTSVLSTFLERSAGSVKEQMKMNINLVIVPEAREHNER